MSVVNAMKEEPPRHNIMCLVGNGFDMAALSWLNSRNDSFAKDAGFGSKVLSGYSNFVDYLVLTKRLDEGTNDVYKKMIENYKKKVSGTSIGDDWCNFEKIVDDKVFATPQPDNNTLAELEKALLELQREFSIFLNNLLPAEKIVEYDRLVSEGRFAYLSLQDILEDMKYVEQAHRQEFKFNRRIRYGHELNYMFVDFNYTMLLDSYVHLDRNQFEPKAFSSSENNFEFRVNPGEIFTEFKYYDRNGSDTTSTLDDVKKGAFVYPTKIITQVVHPHGIQDVPRSILFGTEHNVENWPANDYRWRFVKHLWAQDKDKYTKNLDETELFIIFGSSISYMDGWWMSEIYNRLLDNEPEGSEDSGTGERETRELIIYDNVTFSKRNTDDILNAFFEACIFAKRDTTKDDKVKKYIYVIPYENGKNVFLGYPENSNKKITYFSMSNDKQIKSVTVNNT